MESSAEEMLNDILGNGLKPVITGDEMVLVGKLPLQFLFLVFVQLRFLNYFLHVLVKVFVSKL